MTAHLKLAAVEPADLGRIENGVFRTVQQIADAAKAPKYGSPAWQARMRADGRLMFTQGNASAVGGIDHDKQTEIERGDSYEVNPQQF